MKDHLNNGQTGIIRHVEFTLGSARKAYIKLSDKKSWLKSNEYILFRQTKLLGSY